MANSRRVRARVLDARGLHEGDKFYEKGDTLLMPLARFEILRRAVKVAEVKSKKSAKKGE